jgi:hypothetical protein
VTTVPTPRPARRRTAEWAVVAPATGIATGGGPRGHHLGRGRKRRTRAERTRLALLITLAVAIVALLAAVLAPLRPSGRSRLLPPVPAGVSQPPLAPVPQKPSATPAEPPGFPTAIPTSSPTGPVEPGAGAGGTQPPRRPPRIRTVSFEAESSANTLNGSSHIRSAPGASGGLAIGSIGGDPASTLRFDGVVVPAAGTYTLTVFYLSAEERSVRIDVNADRTGVVTFAAIGDWETVGSLALRVDLRAGANSITFSNRIERGPDVDRITIGN